MNPPSDWTCGAAFPVKSGVENWASQEFYPVFSLRIFAHPPYAGKDEPQPRFFVGPTEAMEQICV